MTLYRDDSFLLLSRTGRGPYSTRAGPQPYELPRCEAEALTAERPFGMRAFRLLRRATQRGRRGGGSGTGLSTRAVRTLEYRGEEYFELEFAVGFPAEEETRL